MTAYADLHTFLLFLVRRGSPYLISLCALFRPRRKSKTCFRSLDPPIPSISGYLATAVAPLNPEQEFTPFIIRQWFLGILCTN